MKNFRYLLTEIANIKKGSKASVLVVSIKGIIDQSDLTSLKKIANVDLVITEPVSEEKLAEMCSGYDFLMLNMDSVKQKGNYKLTRSFYSKVKNLKAICVDMTGLDYFSPEEAKKHNVELVETNDYSTRSVAETILGEILLHSRNRHLSYMDMVDGKEPEARKGINLLNKTAGIVGYGNIGSEVADILRAIGMNVIAWDPFPKPGLDSVSLEELFEKSDVISINAKTITTGKDNNVGMINSKLLKKCKNTIIVNLANFVLVDNEALILAIKTEKVLGYSVQAVGLQGTDIKTKEKLSKLKNVHLCPADAWDSDESRQLLKKIWVENMINLQENK
jgi:phosphoglycerate dehydrogenase-like enzyme